MTPKCPTFHQQRTRSADASNIADVKTSIKTRQSDVHPLITMLLGVHGQTGNNMRQQSYFGSAGCRRCAARKRLHAGRFRDQVPGFSGLHPTVFSGYTPLFARQPRVKLPICQLCSTCVLQICSMDVLQSNNKQNQTTVRSKV